MRIPMKLGPSSRASASTDKSMGIESVEVSDQHSLLRLREPVLVAPSTPSKLQNASYFLSNLDQNLAVVMQTVYFFKGIEDASHDPAEVIRKALADVLVQYYPLAGRLSLTPDMRLEVLCTDEGAMLVEAEANLTMEQFAKETKLGHGLEADLMQFVYNVPGAETILDTPLLVAQVTKFRCGGFVLGLCTNHALFDGIGAMEFVNSWAETARGSPLTVTPYLDRTMLRARDPLRIEFPHPEYLDIENNDKKLGKEHLVFRSISFDEIQLESLKKRILSEGAIQKCSSFEAFSALVWKCRTTALSNGEDQQTKLLFAVDVRKRLEPALPEGYMGNGILLTCALTSVSDLVNGSLSHAIELIREAIHKVNNGYLRSLIDFYEKTRLRPSLESTLVITTWSRLAFHTTDFGWGTPAFTAPASLPEPAVALILPRGESRKGFELVLGLPPAPMDKFVSLLVDTNSV